MFGPNRAHATWQVKKFCGCTRAQKKSCIPCRGRLLLCRAVLEMLWITEGYKSHVLLAMGANTNNDHIDATFVQQELRALTTFTADSLLRIPALAFTPASRPRKLATKYVRLQPRCRQRIQFVGRGSVFRQQHCARRRREYIFSGPTSLVNLFFAVVLQIALALISVSFDWSSNREERNNQ